MDYSVIISVSVSSIISVVGWIVVNYQNRKAYKEDMQMKAYNKIFDKTNDLICEYQRFVNDIHKHINAIDDSIAQRGNNAKNIDVLNTWYQNVNQVIDKATMIDISTQSYMRTVNMSAIDSKKDGTLCKDISSVYFDTQRAILSITNLWVNHLYLDTSNIKENIKKLKTDTETNIVQLGEFNSCLEDILVHLYNSYIADPLKISRRSIGGVDNRRCITKDGIVDNRHF